MESTDSASDVYDSIYDSLLAMPNRHVLARSSYGVDFARHIVANNIWDYRSLNGAETFETILVGEIMPTLSGTRFSAKGNHFVGSLFNVCACMRFGTLCMHSDRRTYCSSRR